MQSSLLRLRNDLYCVGWGVKLYSLTHSHQNRRPLKRWRRRACTHGKAFSKRLLQTRLVTHAHLLDDYNEAFCATCYTSLTVNHILIECDSQFNHLHQQYHFGSTLKDLFNNTSVNDIIAFIKNTLFIIAYNRCSTFLYCCKPRF